MTFNVGNIEIGGNKTTLIAEVGVNHLKNLEYAEELVKTAARAGADIVKFQTYDANKLTTKNAPRFWSWDGERDASGSQYDSYSVLATPEFEFTKRLKGLCDKYNVEFMSTPFDEGAADVLNSLECSAFKIASGDITNYPLLRKVASFKKPIFLSTGASNLHEINNAIEEIRRINENCDICLMHCTLCYPTRAEDANLSAIIDLATEHPDCVIGYSDHTIGHEIPSASILYGVKVIEKHYTFDNQLPDSADHWLSINEEGLSLLAKTLRKLEKAIGCGHKVVLASEELAKKNARRSLVANGPIKKGEKFTYENLIAKRPASGVCPSNIDEVVGKLCNVDMSDDQVLIADYIDGDTSFKKIDVDLLQSKNGWV